MLEIKNLTKIYQPKRGNTVKALDDISIEFPETGMVFVLGKSGSGKSTLLNLMGGLDAATSGEIIIKGKSSKDFTQSDFDSYRNTYLGFIFQEYNILNEFSVGQNIALALELQGQKNNPEAVGAILSMVDMAGYANRKPYELSGGQKQRVAIARALVKEPQIIMADEPSGALDSNTGRQIFETLQQLSKTKLVIVVSHDREYAQNYGDRIIEFQDGKIISDINQYLEAGVSESEGNLLATGESIIQIKKGHKLSPADKKRLLDFLDNADSNIILSKDDYSNQEFQKAAYIDAEGNRKGFKDTTKEDVVLKQYLPQDFNLKKSRLPMKHAFRMGASSLKLKPIRLFITTLLCLVAFGLFGVIDTISAYDRVLTTWDSLQTSDITTTAIDRREIDGDGWSRVTGFTEQQASEFSAKFSHMTFDYLWEIEFSRSWFGSRLFDRIDNRDLTIVPNWNGVIEANASRLDYFGFNLIAGQLPTAANQIAITRYHADIMVHHDLRDFDTDMRIRVDNINDLIGQSITVWSEEWAWSDYAEIIDIVWDEELQEYVLVFEGGYMWLIVESTYIITGIIDTYLDLERYDILRQGWDIEGLNFLFLWREFISLQETSHHFSVFVAPDYMDTWLQQYRPDDWWFNPNPIRSLITTIPTDRSEALAFIAFSYEYNGGVRFALNNPVSSTIDIVNNMVDNVASVFLWVGIVLAIFASLMFLNYIAMSITNKSQEIGILRAIGARGSDVFRIFFSQALIMTVINSVLAIVLTVIIAAIINQAIINEGIYISALSFSIRQVALIIAIGLLTAFISSFLPVYNVARKKPVDAIKR